MNLLKVVLVSCGLVVSMSACTSQPLRTAASTPAGTGDIDSSTDRPVGPSTQAELVRVCGSVFKTDDGDLGIADRGTKISYILVFQEVAEPPRFTKKLIRYQSDVAQSLRLGEKVCAMGLKGHGYDSLNPVFNLIDWVLLDSK